MKRSALLFLALSLVFQVSSAAAVTQYNITGLGAFGTRPWSGWTAASYAYAVNDLGHVAGDAKTDGSSQAFIWQNYVMTGLGTLPSGGGSSYAFGINDADVVVGYSNNSAFSWASGAMTDLGQLPGSGPCERKVAFGVNSSGVISGISQVYVGNVCGDTNIHTYGFRFSGTGPMSYLPGLDRGTNIDSWPQAINNNGTIAGWNSNPYNTAQNGAFVLTSSGYLVWLGDLGAPSGSGHISYAYGINDVMSVVGRTTSPRTGNGEAFIWNTSGGMVTLGDFEGGPYYSTAYGINNSRQVVGTGYSSIGSEAFIWDSVNGMVSLNSLIVGASGWQLKEARDINNNGQIVGWGTNPVGGTEAFLLTPAPPDSPLIGFSPPSSPTSFVFTATVGGANPANKTLNIYNAQTGTLSWAVSSAVPWLTLSPTSGQQEGTVTMSVNIANLSVGTYMTNVQITGNAANSPQSIQVTLTVAGPPTISLLPTSLSYIVQAGSSDTQQLRITNTGGGIMAWSATRDQNWIGLMNYSGHLVSGAYTLADVSVSSSGMAEGTHNGNVTITAVGATNTPQVVPVSMTIRPQITITYPNGGETLRYGQNVTITWNVDTAQTVAKTDTSYSLDGGTTWKLIKSQRNIASSCPWRVPSLKATNNNCLVKVEFKNAAGAVIGQDRSNAVFTITK